nr:hypothetical protein CFP56_33436 [Quercus suber]
MAAVPDRQQEPSVFVSTNDAEKQQSTQDEQRQFSQVSSEKETIKAATDSRGNSDADGETNSHEKARILVVLIAVFTCMFLVALDRTIISTVSERMLRCALRAKAQDYCTDDRGRIHSGNPSNHSRFPVAIIGGMVWLCLSPDMLCIPALVRQTLHLLFCQRHIPKQPPFIRDRLCYLWCSTKFNRFHHW